MRQPSTVDTARTGIHLHGIHFRPQTPVSEVHIKRLSLLVAYPLDNMRLTFEGFESLVPVNHACRRRIYQPAAESF